MQQQTTTMALSTNAIYRVLLISSQTKKASIYALPKFRIFLSSRIAYALSCIALFSQLDYKQYRPYRLQLPVGPDWLFELFCGEVEDGDVVRRPVRLPTQLRCQRRTASASLVSATHDHYTSIRPDTRQTLSRWTQMFEDCSPTLHTPLTSKVSARIGNKYEIGQIGLPEGDRKWSQNRIK